MALLEQLTKLSNDICNTPNANASIVGGHLVIRVTKGFFIANRTFTLAELDASKTNMLEVVLEEMRDELYENHHDLERAKRG